MTNEKTNEDRTENTTENIIQETVSLIRQYMPYLTSTAETADKLSCEQSQRAKHLWSCIKPSFQEHRVSKRIIEDLEGSPYNTMVHNMFRYQLSMQLKQDRDLASQMLKILYTQ